VREKGISPGAGHGQNSSVALHAPPDDDPATVLLVEDDYFVRRLLAEVLRRDGHKVLVARDGEEALGLAARHSSAIDLMVTDLVMPRLGGIEAARALWAHHPETRIIYVSGDGGAIQALLAQHPGCALLRKPFSPGAFVSQVREALASPSAA
jgi:two-component system, cell cycle sensor histidine kinase and response regulator CckA